MEHDIISATSLVAVVVTNTASVCALYERVRGWYFFFFLHVCVYVFLVKLSHVPVSFQQRFSNPVPPRSPLPLTSTLSSISSSPLITRHPFFSFFPQSLHPFIQIPLWSSCSPHHVLPLQSSLSSASALFLAAEFYTCSIFHC